MEDEVLLELVKQYGQLATAFVSSDRNYCLRTEDRLNFLEDRIKHYKKEKNQ